MHLPSISPDNKTRDYIDVFGGYNHNPRINDNEFYDMQNLSSDSYPLLSVRPRRGDIPESKMMSGRMLSNKGMIYRNGLYYIVFGDPYSATQYYTYLIGPGENGAQIYAVWASSDTTTIRKIIPMGAKLIILPDNRVVNINTPSYDFNENAARINNNTTSSGSVSIQPCLADGTVLTIDFVGDDVPDQPVDGYVWLDTRSSPAVLKKYYAMSGMWQSFISSYVKITAGNTIGNGFAVDDGVKISGFTVNELEGLNQTAIIKAISENKKSIVVTGSLEPIPTDDILIAEYTKEASTIPFYCDKNLESGAYAGKTIQIGEKAYKCSTNTSAAAATYVPTIGGDNLCVESFALSVSVAIGNDATNIIHVKADGTTMSGFGRNIKGQMVCVGAIDRRNLATIIAFGSSPSQDFYIVLDTNFSNLAVDTKIYPVEATTVTGKYLTSLSFVNENNQPLTVSVKQGDRACPTLSSQYTETAEITFSRKMPQMDFVIESQNRLWGCRYGEDDNGEFVNEIYCSKLGDEKNWEVYQGISTDSYRASVGSEGAWTGAVNYRGYPVFFKENHIHSVLGNYPPYQISDTTARGIQKGSSESLAMVNEVLYYKSVHGICAYSGGLPADISSVLGGVHYKDAIACAYKGKYYICMKDTSGHPVFFAFDTVRGLWHKEDDFYAVQFAVADDDVYFIKKVDDEYVSGSLLGTGGEDNTPIEWYAETGILGLSMIDSKYISRINLRLMLPIGASMYVSIMYDSSGEWEQVGNIEGHSLLPFTLPIKPRRCDHFRLRLEGCGDMKLYGISKTIEQGSDRCLI